MKSLIVYASKTGNTRKLAQAIYDVLPQEKLILPVGEAPDPHGYDLVAVGFWLQGGLPEPLSREFLARLEGQKVFLFATHAAAKGSEHAAQAMNHAMELAQGGTVVGTFSCPGEVDPAFLEKARVKEPAPPWLADAPAAKGHPNEEDLAELRAVVSRLVE